ncbi:hypothetical protein BDF19DRAFT_415915 [Syncephalis fuscata]|nr:hypothetical protein BDF19DRAFT_415915 [Syncephalis fuscata]
MSHSNPALPCSCCSNPNDRIQQQHMSMADSSNCVPLSEPSLGIVVNNSNPTTQKCSTISSHTKNSLQPTNSLYPALGLHRAEIKEKSAPMLNSNATPTQLSSVLYLPKPRPTGSISLPRVGMGEIKPPQNKTTHQNLSESIPSANKLELVPSSQPRIGASAIMDLSPKSDNNQATRHFNSFVKQNGQINTRSTSILPTTRTAKPPSPAPTTTAINTTNAVNNTNTSNQVNGRIAQQKQ